MASLYDLLTPFSTGPSVLSQAALRGNRRLLQDVELPPVAKGQLGILEPAASEAPNPNVIQTQPTPDNKPTYLNDEAIAGVMSRAWKPSDSGWGGVAGMVSESSEAAGGRPTRIASYGAPLRDVGQMRQDFAAREGLNAQHAQALAEIDRLEAQNDPMRKQLEATGNLRKLESLLPAKQRELYAMGKTPGAFRQVGKDSYQNVPDVSPTQGQVLSQFLDPKFAALGEERIGREAQLYQLANLLGTQERLNAKVKAGQMSPEEAEQAFKKALTISMATMQALSGGKDYSGFIGSRTLMGENLP